CAARLVVRTGPIVERRGIGGPPPDCVAGGIKGAGHPAATAAGAPGFVPPSLQCVIRPADRQKLPFLLAGCGVDTEDRAAIGPFATLSTDHHHTFCIKWGAGEPDGQLLRVD